ncbi:MAG: hypothetical protein IJV38_08020 [Prevotella sp.]|nr:hypothetical protein [Prevotella sp.]
MKPVEFAEANATFGANQPEYQPLPAMVIGDAVVSCWELTDEEKQQVMKEGKIWLGVMTFGQALQPVLLTCNKSDVIIDPNGTVSLNTEDDGKQ